MISKVMRSFDLEKKIENHNAISKIEKAPKYIFPTFKEIIPSANGKPIMIFSAPGAVGKTTFAKYFAYQKNSYYWDLSKLKLGDNTFIGTVADCFGHENLVGILQRLEKGEISFFFDGFDEAEMISGLDGIYNFVTEIYKYVKKSPHVNVIFFSRTETVEWILLSLEEIQESESFSLYEIDYFGYKGALDFIKLVLEESGDTSFLTHVEPFHNVVNKIFNVIGAGLEVSPEEIWNHDISKSFLGYSPVLQTIGNYLAGQNYIEIQNSFDGSQVKSGLNVISDFINSLLQREQNKVINSLRENINCPARFDGWEMIYSPEVQLKCIVTYLDSKYDSTSIIQFIQGEPWLENAYMEAVIQFLPNHPFIRKGDFASVSFKDYTLAYLLSINDFKDDAFGMIKKNDYTFSPLFAGYYSKMSNKKCLGIHAGLIYDSVSSKLQYGNSQLLTVSKEKDNEYSLDISYEDGDGQINSFSFDCILSEETPLVFEKRLHNAIILIDNHLKLGGGRSFEVRDSEISCSDLHIDASDITVNCYEESIVNIVSANYNQITGNLKVRKLGENDFNVNFPGSRRYPWSEYYNENLKMSTLEDNSFSDKLYALKLILTPFRKHNKNAFGKQHEYIENIIVKDNSNRKLVFEKLLRNGVLVKSHGSPMYELNDSKLQQYGINWGDLKSLNMNEKLEKFLS